MELLVVLTVMLILTSAIVSGYTNMQRAQRINRSTEALLSTLNLARNLAISNNAVAYVEIVGNDPANPVNNGAKQMLKIHIFPNPADALTVNGEPAANTSVTNPVSTTPANLVQLAPNAWNPTAKNPWIEPLSIPYTDGTSTQIPGYGQAYNNYVAESLTVEPNTVLGVYPLIATIDPVTGTAPVLIGFNSDGTCCTPAAKLYVTDDPKRLYNTDATTFGKAAQGHDPHLKVIDVFAGGLIKLE